MSSRSNSRKKSTKQHAYQRVTARILEQLEQGTVPWRKPWTTDGRFPANLVSGKDYRGVNVMLLGFQPYGSRYWVTYKQAQQLGGHVRKGEQGTPIVYWQKIKVKEKADGTRVTEEREVPFCRVYTVFNVDQTEGLEHDRLTQPEPTFSESRSAESIVAGYPAAPEIRIGGDAAFYRPSADLVCVPEPGRFASQADYYSALFHELTHSTGHRKRLARDGVVNPIRFGSHDYSKEELIAEMGAAFLSSLAGVETSDSLANSAAYLDGWRRKLSQEPKWIVQAGSAAQKAVDHIVGAAEVRLAA